MLCKNYFNLYLLLEILINVNGRSYQIYIDLRKTSRLINANKNSYFWYELTLWTSTIKRYGSSALQCRVNVLFSMIRSGCSKLEYPE